MSQVVSFRVSDDQMAVLQERASGSVGEYCKGLVLGSSSSSLPAAPADSIVVVLEPEVRDWVVERAKTYEMSLPEYLRRQVVNVRRQWLAQMRDPILRAKAQELYLPN